MLGPKVEIYPPRLAMRAHAQAEKLAVLVERQLGLGDVVATLGVGDETLAALADPLDRPRELAGRPGDHGFLGVVELLDPEAAAHVGRHHAQLVLRDVQHEEPHQQADDVRELAGRPQRVLAGRRIVFGDRRARLHRIADQAIVDQADARDMRGLPECGLGRRRVAERPIAAQVTRHVVEQERRPGLDCIEHADHGGQHVIVDRDRLGGARRLLARFGDHEGDGVADMAHLALRQGGMRRLLHGQPVLAGDAPAAGQPAHAVGLEVRAGHHRQHARHGERIRGIDRCDDRVGVRRAHEHARGHVGTLDVGHVIAAAGEEAQVLLAARRSPDADDLRHGQTPFRHASPPCHAART